MSDNRTKLKKRAINTLRELSDAWSAGESRLVEGYSQPLSYMINALFEEHDRLKEELEQLKGE